MKNVFRTIALFVVGLFGGLDAVERLNNHFANADRLKALLKNIEELVDLTGGPEEFVNVFVNDPDVRVIRLSRGRTLLVIKGVNLLVTPDNVILNPKEKRFNE